MNALARLSEAMADVAVRELRRRILDNVWPPGYQALEQELALAMGMSRTPIHEAMTCLPSEGLVDLIPRRSLCVLPVSDRNSVVQGKSVSVLVDLGGRRLIKQ